MRRSAVVVSGSLGFLCGCYVEMRARGDVASGAGSAVGGSMVAVCVTAGLELSIDDDARYRTLLGLGGERVTASSRTLGIKGVNTSRLEMGLHRPWSGRSSLTRSFDLRFGLAGISNTMGGNVSEVRLGGAASFGPRHVSIMIGPTVSYWDAARSGTALGIGLEAGVHLNADPRDLIRRVR